MGTRRLVDGLSALGTEHSLRLVDGSAVGASLSCCLSLLSLLHGLHRSHGVHGLIVTMPHLLWTGGDVGRSIIEWIIVVHCYRVFKSLGKVSNFFTTTQKKPP
jgi:hypothetical protein